MIRHIDDRDLGSFDYDDTLWEVKLVQASTEDSEYLREDKRLWKLKELGDTDAIRKLNERLEVGHTIRGRSIRLLQWIGGDQVCNLPKGCISCAYMFEGLTLGKDFKFGDFDTHAVIDMHGMFERCTLLGIPDLDTSNVKNMSGMFYQCKLQGSCGLGPNFITENVTDMSYMFCECTLPNNFYLGEHFDTSKVTSMSHMFADALESLSHFTLGNKFDTRNVKYMDAMFMEDELPSGFTLGDNFDTYNVTDLSSMFEGAQLPDGFTFGRKFNTENVLDMSNMFKGADFLGNIKIGFSTKSAIMMLSMFERCEVNGYFNFGEQFELCKHHECIFRLCSVDGQQLPATKAEDILKLFKWKRAATEIVGHSEINGHRISWMRLAVPEDTNAPTGMNIADETSYDFTKLLSVPEASLKFCKNMQDLQEIVDKYCKLI